MIKITKQVKVEIDDNDFGVLSDICWMAKLHLDAQGFSNKELGVKGFGEYTAERVVEIVSLMEKIWAA